MKIEVATLREVHADFRRIQYSVRISSGIRLPEASGIVFCVENMAEWTAYQCA